MKFLCLLILLISCGDDSFPKIEKLDSFRILGISASSPEVNPGAVTTLNILVSDVDGTENTISGNYVACIDPGVSRGAEVSCDHDQNKVSGPYNIDMTNLTPDNNFRTGLTGDLNITVPANILDGATAIEQFNGKGYLVIFNFSYGEKTYKAFKRIAALTGRQLNTNISSVSLLINDVIGSTAPADNDQLKVSTSLPENYQIIQVDGTIETRSENFEIAWYTTEGEFDKPKSSPEEDVLFKQGTTPPHMIVAVVRDERGGLGWVKFIPSK